MKTVYDKRTTYVTMDGTEIHFKPFSFTAYEMALENLRSEYRKRGEQIDKPQYVVKFESGAIQTFDHDEKSIKQAPQGTPDNEIDAVLEAQQAQWQAWIETTAKFDKESNDILWDFVRYDSLGDLALPADTTWETRQARRHVPIPTDPEEKLMHYLNTELCKSSADKLELLTTIALVSQGIVEEAHLESAKRSFRHSLWSDGLKQLERRYTPGTAENTQVGRVDSEPTPDSDPGAETVAINEG